MRNSKRFLPGVVLLLGLFVGAPSAQALMISDFNLVGSTTLSNWNVSNLDGTVTVENGTVDFGLGAGNQTAFLVYWNGDGSLSPQWIDKFWYDFTCVNASDACKSYTESGFLVSGNNPNQKEADFTTGNVSDVSGGVYVLNGSMFDEITSDWSLNEANKLHADGFDYEFAGGGNETSGNSGTPGGDSMATALLFVLDGELDFSSFNDLNPIPYAVHVVFGNDCSGYLSNTELKDGTVPGPDPNCAVGTPEPSSVALLGIVLFALASLSAWRRRKASTRVG
jgi:hypothetical protein